MNEEINTPEETHNEPVMESTQSTYDTYLEELGNTEFVETGLEMMMPPTVDYEDKINDMLGL